MATGAYDSNGIWQYGESDNIALFSDLLNKSAASVSTAFTSDRARLATLEAGSLAGLIPVVPTSIVVATGTGATSTNGTVTVTGATNLSLNGVFTPKYRNYRIVFNMNCPTTGSSFSMRLRAAGTDNSAASYSYVGRRAISWSYGDGGGTATTSWSLIEGISGQGTTQTSVATIDLTTPQVSTVRTGLILQSGFIAEGSAYYGSAFYAGSHNVTASFDGVSFIPAGGTFTGTVNVYGYNN